MPPHASPTRGVPARPSAPFTVQRSGERAPYKPKPWSHQDHLKAAVGKIVTIELSDDSTLAGMLIAADAYTMLVQDRDAPAEPVLVFKSGVLRFRVGA